jgi:glycosyltransferase involved in cell wall biosynthesis
MPSRFEGLSISTVEAMACGLPLVLYDVPGLRDLINDDDNGLLISEDVGELVKAVHLLADEPELLLHKSRSGRINAETNYSLNSGVSGIVSIYNKVST